ncbi:Uu.00g076520.m01.CDS01 [Anthostomella pinea]|uniref:Uu.00g076520.m01.CDS01 n=1 Tax=Anthostomella pinea TaxID=933095 RepID=A0AAI8VVV7_9PEZI|nr:Uu.00g076520.m01.CDS01 [Anthostomella pinea]
MSPRLRPLQLPLLVEERRKAEEAAQAECVDGEAFYHVYTTDSSSSDATSPVTPTFSARGHLRYSSSMSSFELATPASPEAMPSSPKQATQTSGKRTLDDVKEEPFEYGSFDSDDDRDDSDDDDDASYRFDLYDCLCDEPCMHRDADLVQSTSNFYAYAQSRDVDYDIGFLSDSDYHTSPSSLKKRRNGSEPPFMGFSHKLGSRFPSLSRWKMPKKSSAINSPVSDYGFEQRPTLSRAASSRSSSLSTSGRFVPDRTNEPPLPPTPALSFYESSDSVTLPGPLDIEKANSILSSIERERSQAHTPLLPPMMTGTSTEQHTAQPSPLELPAIACPTEGEPHSPLVLSPPLSTKPSISSFRMPPSKELHPMPAPDAWSDRLGHANFTIMPIPYKPEVTALYSLQQLRTDWETARVNYTKHLVRTGEHYGITSKTYALTEAKWAETQRTWRGHHDEVAEAVVASGEATACEKFDEGGLTIVPRMDAEGKFPQRGDEDIVGPMVREATMCAISGMERKRPGFWRNLTDRVSLRK